MTWRFQTYLSITICGLSLLSALSLHSQNQTNNWYFGGNAGLSFANGEVNVLSNGSMDTPEGCSVISDKQGELLFYSNGQTIWNKNHEVMENGQDLSGEITNNQSVLIIGHPKTNDRFYVFYTRKTTTFDGSKRAGLYFSEILITPEAPLGTIVTRDIFLRPRVSEKLAATYNPKDDTVSILMFGKSVNNDIAPYDTFYIYKIGRSGFTGPVVRSTQMPNLGTDGPLKISPNNKYIALADFEGTSMYIFDFDIDNSTITLKENFGTFIPFSPVYVYGLEFSQDSQVLYFSGKNLLLKYSIEPVVGFERRKFITSSSDYSFGSLQLARNGKIYVASYSEDTALNRLGVINQPNDFFDAIGFEPMVDENGLVVINDNSDFIELSQDLGTGVSKLGLPLFLASELRNRIVTKNRCVNEAFLFELDTYDVVDSVVWDFGDGNSSTEIAPEHLYNLAGNYKVKATITMDGCIIDLFKDVEAYVVPDPVNNQTLKQCLQDGSQPAVFNLYEIEDKLNLSETENRLKFYTSLIAAEADQDSIQNPVSYVPTTTNAELFVRIISPKNCSDIANFFLQTVSIDVKSLEPLTQCENSDGINGNGIGRFDLEAERPGIFTQLNLPTGSKVEFYETEVEALTEENKLPDKYDSASKTVWARIETGNNDCSGLATLKLTLNSSIDLAIKDKYILCYNPIGSVITLDGGTGNEKWEWQDSAGTLLSEERIFEIKSPGTYTIKVSKTENNLECSRTKNFEVEHAENPSISSVKTGNGEIFIRISGSGDYLFSLDDQNYEGSGVEHLFENVRGGIYTVYVIDSEACKKPLQTNVAIISFPKFFTPNGDGFNDYWKVYGVSREFYKSANINIFNRYGRLLYTMDSIKNEIGWDGLINGQPLFANDYWFEVNLIDIDGNSLVETGHFTLKY